MLLNRYERTATGIRLHDVDGSHVDMVADDALTLIGFLLRDRQKLTQIADAQALRNARASRKPLPFTVVKRQKKKLESDPTNNVNNE